MLGWGGGGQFCNLLDRSGYIKNHYTLVEIQVENHGSNIDLKKLFVYGFGSFMSVFTLGVNFPV